MDPSRGLGKVVSIGATRCCYYLRVFLRALAIGRFDSGGVKAVSYGPLLWAPLMLVGSVLWAAMLYMTMIYIYIYM